MASDQNRPAGPTPAHDPTPTEDTMDSSSAADKAEARRTTDPHDANDLDLTEPVDLAAPVDLTEPVDRAQPVDRAEPVDVPSSAGPAAGAAAVVSAPEPANRGIRVGTVVWGLVVAAIGVGLVAWASGVVFDVELALIILVAAAGVALLAGSLVSAAKRRGA